MQNTKIKQVIVLRIRYPDGQGGTRKVRTGKLVAQGAHASMAFLSKRVTESPNPQFSEVEKQWLRGKFTKICWQCFKRHKRRGLSPTSSKTQATPNLAASQPTQPVVLAQMKPRK
jgi:peptidyl-tRNA hydrolase